jgi:aspartyl-tRNA(Asn)/glutamyl-tRNA(Gln) amidotransferase subunit A
MDEDIFYADATELAARIRTKALSPVEVIHAHLQRIDEVNPKINAIVTIAEDAVEQARAAEAAIMRGDEVGALHGVPFTNKDVVDNIGVRTTRGSKLFQDRIAGSDATVVSRLKGAGAIFLAKTNIPEFALGHESENLVFGRTLNPWNLDRTPGGSSGGEAAAIVAGLSPLGIGSDLGGSIRMPAHYCGIVGLKPTHGRVPLTGCWPDLLMRACHVGPMARTVKDVALALQVISGPDNRDPYALPFPPPEIPDPKVQFPKPRIGWSAELGFTPVAPEVEKVLSKAAECLASFGCEVRPVALEGLERPNAQVVSSIIILVESNFYFRPLVAERGSDLHPVTRGRLRAVTPTLEEYLEATADWEKLRQDMAQYFADYDLLLCPSVPVVAHPHGEMEHFIEGRGTAGHPFRTLVPWNLTGSPAISVPFGWSSDGLPIGVQLVGRHYDEITVLRAAMLLESAGDTSNRHPFT